MYEHSLNSLGDPHDAHWIEALVETASIGLMPIESGMIRKDYSNTYQNNGRGAANEELRKLVESDDPLIKVLITNGYDISATAMYLAKRFYGCQRIDQIERVCDKYSLPIPKARSEEGVFLRAQSSIYWSKYIGQECRRYHEGKRRESGLVKQGIAKYVSDHALELIQLRDEAMRDYLENKCIAESDHGEICSGAELVDKSTTTPHKRGIELMVRSRGFEEYAEKQGHCWTFLTITAPPEYHAFYKDTGRPVLKFNYTRPDECHQQYFKPCWQGCRAALNRRGIRFYGFRVCEPHHDGTPHWHMLIFCESEEQLAQFKHAVRQAYSPDAPNDERRIKFEDHDPSKGGAADYIGKYIGKNISGKAIDEDEKGDVPRAQAWARIWGFHQFEQLGGPPVGVYRDLRKIRDMKLVPEPMRAAWEAADGKDWCRFIEVMGGPFLGNKYPIKNVRGLKKGINGESSPSKNSYGEPLVTEDYDIRPVVGLSCEGIFLKTYDRVWKIRPGNIADHQAALPATEGCGAWTCVNNCTDTSYSPANPGHPALKMTTDTTASNFHQLE